MTSPQNDDPTPLDETDAETPLLASEPTDSDPAEAQEASHQWWLLLLSPLSHDRDDAKSVFMGMVSMVLVGSILGFVFFGHGSPPELLSGCIGYTYFVGWSVSFYPQFLQNFRRKSTQGLAVDFCALNVVGFACYAAYNVAFYCTPEPPLIQSNDVAFSVHALILSCLTLGQVYYYDSLGRRPVLILTGSLVGGLCLVAGALVGLWTWRQMLYMLSFVKIGISFIKYIPQVILNYQRKSTVGWSIWQILLDLQGGVLSDAQLLLDGRGNMEGNWAKLCLGSVSILFDTIFLTQHYILYRNRDETRAEHVETEVDSPEAADGGNV